MNHIPATPLPWEQIKGTSLVVQKDGYVEKWGRQVRLVVADCPRPERKGSLNMQRQNAAYITHTANSYPKLIKALEEIRRLMPGYDDNEPGCIETVLFLKATEALCDADELDEWYRREARRGADYYHLNLDGRNTEEFLKVARRAWDNRLFYTDMGLIRHAEEPAKYSRRSRA